jgi:hypothetical protein
MSGVFGTLRELLVYFAQEGVNLESAGTGGEVSGMVCIEYKGIGSVLPEN